MILLYNLISHLIQQHSTISYTKPHLSIMKHIPTLLSTLQLLSIGVIINMGPSSTNKRLTPVKAVVVADQ